MNIKIIFYTMTLFQSTTADLAGQNRLGNTVQNHLQGVRNINGNSGNFLEQIKIFYGDDLVTSDILKIVKKSASRKPRRRNLRIRSYFQHFH